MGVNVDGLRQLKKTAEALTKKLDSVIVRATPCPFNRKTVETEIDGFAHYRFRKMSGLCNYNLSPILKSQVEEALRAGRADLAMEMLVPILGFFSEFVGNLDDSDGSGSEFASYDWAKCLEKTISQLPQGWANDAIVRELLKTISECGDYADDLEESKTSLLDLLSEDQPEDRPAQRQRVR